MVSDLEEVMCVEVVRWVKGSDMGEKLARCARQENGRAGGRNVAMSSTLSTALIDADRMIRIRLSYRLARGQSIGSGSRASCT